MKRAVVIVILFSMILHCASRLGLISYLHGQRHNIAYTIGLIAEVPIAVCSGKYFADHAPLLIPESNEQDEDLPIQHLQAQEIVLFIENKTKFSATRSGKTVTHNTLNTPATYLSPPLTIFHPPCITA